MRYDSWQRRDVAHEHVRELINKERLAARKIGCAYVMRSKDVSLFTPFKVGRPSKSVSKNALRKAEVMKEDSSDMRNCCLCSSLISPSTFEAWNYPLFESPNFVVLPSLGALIEGWLLLVPKKHFICMGAVPGSIAAEMQEMKDMICKHVQQYYGQVCVFEHGPSRANVSVGCGVDHAHLHIVPVAFDLISAVTPLLPEDTIWSGAKLEECQAAFKRGEDYLYIEQPVGVGLIATNQGFGSQLFRRAIATQIGIANQFNWREYPQLPNVLVTIDKAQSWNGSVLSCKRKAEVAA